MRTANYREIVTHLMDRTAFTGSSMTAETGPQNPWRTGSLTSENEAYKMYRDHADRMVYVVRSYYTPIAWVLDDGTVFIVDQYFSRTTSRAQKLVRTYL